MPKNYDFFKEEERIVNIMIDIHSKNFPLAKEDNEELKNYAKKKLYKCKFGKKKTTCQNCQVHCYEKKYKARMKEVMLYSSKKILFQHPLLALQHLRKVLKEKRARKL